MSVTNTSVAAARELSRQPVRPEFSGMLVDAGMIPEHIRPVSTEMAQWPRGKWPELCPRELLELRRFGWSLSDDRQLRGCGRRIPRGDVGTSDEVRDLTVQCRRKWLCPTCGDRAARSQSMKYRRELIDWRASGGSNAFMTLTQWHSIDDELTELWDRLECGWDRLKQGAGWDRNREAYGLRGYNRVVEVVHHPASGWNVHLHVVLHLAHALTDDQQDDLMAALAARFIRGIKRSGGDANLASQDLRPVSAGTEWPLARYCFKGTRPRRAPDGSRTPMSILADLRSTGEGFALWEEFTAAVNSRRRTQVTRSQGMACL
jgi:Replication protein